MRYSNMRDIVGGTPCVQVRTEAACGTSVFVKLEGANPTGSIKDRTCSYLLKGVLGRGELQPGMRILDASSGNLACSLAYFGKLMGYDSTVVVNSKLTESKRQFLQYYGATIHQHGDFTSQGNALCRSMFASEPGHYCFLDQLHNWDNAKAHYETTGPEILADFSRPAMVVGSLGSGGSLLGTGRLLKERSPSTKVVAVQSAPGTRLPGTGSFQDGDYMTPLVTEGFEQKIFDHTIAITEQDAVRRTIELRNQGLFCGLQTGGVLHAALQAIREFEVTGEVVVLSGDAGWKNMDKLLHL